MCIFFFGTLWVLSVWGFKFLFLKSSSYYFFRYFLPSIYLYFSIWDFYSMDLTLLLSFSISFKFSFFFFLAVLGLRFCARAFSSCGKWGPLFIAVHGPLTIVASPVGSTGSRRAGSVIVAHGPSRSATCGILPDQGSNPCPLHWQADSQPLHHQGSPKF